MKYNLQVAALLGFATIVWLNDVDTRTRSCHNPAMRLVTEHPAGARLGDFLQSGLTSNARAFRGAVAFLRASGMLHLQPLIRAFSNARSFELIVGVDLQGTTVEGLEMLSDALGQHGRAFIYHNNGASTFHPKLFSFTYADRTELYVGSGNLTAGGLFTNHEAGLVLSLGAAQAEAQLLHQITDALDRWSINAGNAARELDAALIDALAKRKLISTEAEVRAAMSANQASSSSQPSPGASLPQIFATVPVAAAPAPLITMPTLGGASAAATGSSSAAGTSAAATAAGAVNPGASSQANPSTRHFVMTLQNTDVGSGQVSVNTARRSPEVFIPLAARDYDPAFWDWPSAFTPDRSRPGKLDRPGVPFLVNGQPTDVHIWFNPTKRDVRLRNEVLRSAGQIGDILHLEKRNSAGVLYVATTIPPTDASYAGLLARCNQPVRNSLKQFGYF